MVQSSFDLEAPAPGCSRIRRPALPQELAATFWTGVNAGMIRFFSSNLSQSRRTSREPRGQDVENPGTLFSARSVLHGLIREEKARRSKPQLKIPLKKLVCND